MTTNKRPAVKGIATHPVKEPMPIPPTTPLPGWVPPPARMPEQLLLYVSHARRKPADRIGGEDKSSISALQKIFAILQAATGHDFSLSKKNSIHRRIERRMQVHQIDTIAGYVRSLQESKREATILFKELLIGVTIFFRDPAGFEVLQDTSLPALFMK